MAVNFPSNPVPGAKYTNPDTGVTYQWKPSTKEWIATGSSEQFQTIISETEPEQKNPGGLWFQPNERILYVYNGQSANWEAIVNPIEGGVTVQGSVDVTSAIAPTDPENGWLYVQTASGVVCPSGWSGIIGNPTHVGQFVLYGADDGNARWFLGGTTDEIGDKFLPLDGGDMRGNIRMGGNYLTNPGSPQSDDNVGDRGYNDLRYVQVLGDDMDGPLRFGGSGILQSKTAPNVYVTASDAWYVNGAANMQGELYMNDNSLIGPKDPTSASGVGDRGYNDSRYVQLAGTGQEVVNSITFKEHVTFEKTAQVVGDLTVGGAAQITSTLQVNSAALFQSSLDLDEYLKVKGAATLESTLTVSKRVTFKRVANNADGFLIEGNPVGGKLFYAYHNNDTSLDAINYTGKTTADSNIMHRSSISNLIDSKVSAAGASNATQSTRGLTYLGQANTGTSTSPTLKKGQLYFNSQLNTLIIGT